MQRKKAECEERQEHYSSKVDICTRQMEVVQADLKKCKAETKNGKCATEIAEVEIKVAQKVKRELIIGCEKDVKWEREVAVTAIEKAERKEWAHRGMAEREKKRAEDAERRLKEAIAATDCSAAERRNHQLQTEATAAEQGRLDIEKKFRQQTKAAAQAENLLRIELEEAKLRIEELEKELQRERDARREAPQQSRKGRSKEREENDLPSLVLNAQESWERLENSTNRSSLAQFEASDDRHREEPPRQEEEEKLPEESKTSDDVEAGPTTTASEPGTDEEQLLSTASKLAKRSVLILLDLLCGVLDQVCLGQPLRRFFELCFEGVSNAFGNLMASASGTSSLRPTWLNSAEFLASLALHGATRTTEHEGWLPGEVSGRPESLLHVILLSWLGFFVYFCSSRIYWLLTSGVPTLQKLVRVPYRALDRLLERHFGLSDVVSSCGADGLELLQEQQPAATEVQNES
mmetsp:Transcript_76004/g.165832  ORF Transcript_76004/g.165832 Transcript_76004/m.165832 type:complete len:463 (-) Transcript_76004:669-2057(-)